MKNENIKFPLHFTGNNMGHGPEEVFVAKGDKKIPDTPQDFCIFGHTPGTDDVEAKNAQVPLSTAVYTGHNPDKVHVRVEKKYELVFLAKFYIRSSLTRCSSR